MMIRRLSVVALWAMAVGLALAAPAHADEYDFISELDAKGIYYSNINTMIDVGKMACHDMRARANGPASAARIGSVGGWTFDEARIIGVAAYRNMCPDALSWFQSQP